MFAQHSSVQSSLQSVSRPKDLDIQGDSSQTEEGLENVTGLHPVGLGKLFSVVGRNLFIGEGEGKA